MPAQQRTTRIVRVRTGCWTCRRRKKKCDEVRPVCAGCKRNDLGCSWPSTVPRLRYYGADAEQQTDEHRRLSIVQSEQPADGVESILEAESPASRRQSSVSLVGCQSVTVPGGPDEAITTIDVPASVDNTESAFMTTVTVGNVVPRTLSMLPGYDAESYQLLSHYLSTTADCMANGSTPLNPFLVQIVPLAFTSDLLLQLVIAQSAAHRAFRRRDESDAVAHSHYTKAIQLFRHRVTDFIDGKVSNLLTLLVGALLMCFTETAKGDVTGTVFNHLSAAHSLLVKLLAQSDTAVPRELENFVIEYYVYTATVSMISIDARLSGQLFLNYDLEQRARELLGTRYVGNLCGCWLELLLLIPCIFDLGRQWRMEDAQATAPTADDIAMGWSIQSQILRWSPYSFVPPDVYLAGLIFQQAVLIYLYTSLGGFHHTADGIYRGLIEAAVAEAMAYLDDLPPHVRINSGLCWPIAVVGSCLIKVEQQERLRDRLAAMASRFGLGNMQRTLLLLEAMWRLPSFKTGPWNICHAMQQNQIWISFA